MVEELWSECSGLPLPQQALAVVKLVERSFGAVRGADIDAISIAKKMNQLQAAQKRANQAQTDQVLQDFRVAVGAEQTSSLLRALPELENLFTAIPSGHLHTFQINPACVGKAVQACAWANQHHGHNLARALGECWSQQHEVVSGASGPPVVPTEKASPCWLAGVCLCSSSGRVLKQLASRFIKVLKDNFRGVMGKELLLKSKVVVKFVCTSGTDIDEASSHKSGSDIYLSIPLMTFSPYRPTFHLVHEIENPEPELAIAGPSVYVKAL